MSKTTNNANTTAAGPDPRWLHVQIAERHLRMAEENQADVEEELKAARSRVKQTWAKLREASRGEEDMPLFQDQAEKESAT